MFKLVRTFILGGLFGKLMGVCREFLAAYLFGAGFIASAFKSAQLAFLLPVNGVISDALCGGFIPVYARRWKEEPGAARTLFRLMHWVALVAALLLTVLLWTLGGRLLSALIPGVSQSTLQLTTRMLQVLSLGLTPFVLVSLYNAVDVVNDDGRRAAARASAQSVGLILGTAAAWYFSQPLLIPAGFVAVYIVLAVMGFRNCRAHGLTQDLGTIPSIAAFAELKEIWLRFRILLLVPLLFQLHYLIERRVCSLICGDNVAVLDYAKFIFETSIMLIGNPFGMAALAKMPAMESDEFSRTARKSLVLLLLVGIPISALLLGNTPFIVRLLFMRGAFDAEAYSLTSQLLAAMALGIWCHLGVYASGKFLTARGQNRSVLMGCGISILINIGLNLWLYHSLGVSAVGYASTAAGLFLWLFYGFRLGLLRTLLAPLLWLLLAGVLVHLLRLALVRMLAPADWLLLAAQAAAWALACASLYLRYLNPASRTPAASAPTQVQP